MNWEAEKIRIHREQEQKQLGGEEAYRLHALQNLKLKTVVKASLGRFKRNRTNHDPS